MYSPSKKRSYRMAGCCLAWVLVLVAGLDARSESPSGNPDVDLFIDEMTEKHGFERRELEAIFRRARYQPAILEAVSRPVEAKPWYQYRPLFINDERIRNGVAFVKQYEKELASAEQVYGVPGAMTSAILGIETGYGKRKGRHVVLDALTTLAFNDPRRSDLFRYELEHYLLLIREMGLEPHEMKGSYAGAIGIAQFMPSSYRRYAVDFDGDGRIDLSRNVADAIGSVGNYFEAYGWRRDAPIAVRASAENDDSSKLAEKNRSRLRIDDWRKSGVRPDEDVPGSWYATLITLKGEKGPEYWLGFDNFFVITEYNHSINYAMAAYHLALEIESRRWPNKSSASGF